MLFLCFLATLVLSCPIFGDDKPNAAWVSLVVGILTLINAVFNCYVIYNHPGFTTAGPKEDPNAASENTGAASSGKGAKKQASEDLWSGSASAPAASSSRPPAPAAPDTFSDDFYGGSAAPAGNNPFGDAPPDSGNGIGDGNPFANI